MKQNNEEVKVVCAWCRKHISGPKQTKLVTHGICDECLKKQLEDFTTLKKLPRKDKK